MISSLTDRLLNYIAFFPNVVTILIISITNNKFIAPHCNQSYLEGAMSIQELPKLTAEELHQAAVGNYNALMFATIEFLKQHRISILDYAHFIGKRHAEGWTPNLTALELAEAMAVNMMSVGGKVEEMKGDEHESQLVVTGWPPKDSIEAFSGNLADADQFMQLVGDIAEKQGCSFGSIWQGDQVLMKFTRKA